MNTKLFVDNGTLNERDFRSMDINDLYDLILCYLGEEQLNSFKYDILEFDVYSQLDQETYFIPGDMDTEALLDNKSYQLSKEAFAAHRKKSDVLNYARKLAYNYLLKAGIISKKKNKTESSSEVITIDEACSYFHIGKDSMRKIVRYDEDHVFTLPIGKAYSKKPKNLIVKSKLEDWLVNQGGKELDYIFYEDL